MFTSIEFLYPINVFNMYGVHATKDATHEPFIDVYSVCSLLLIETDLPMIFCVTMLLYIVLVTLLYSCN